MPMRDRQRADQRRHRRHHDRPEADQTGLVDRLARRLAVLALRFDREVDHHDAVLLHQADQHDDADERVEAQLGLEQISSVSSAPKPADGSPERIVSGCVKLS